MRQHVIRYAAGLLVLLVLLLHASELPKIALIDSFENRLYDTRLKLAMPKTVDDRLVILDIDEKSLAEIGRWPWGRDKIAILVNKLFDEYGVVALGFDLFLAEPDQSSGLDILEQLGRNELRHNAEYLAELNRLRPHLNYDQIFVDSIRGRRVLLSYYFADEGRNSGTIPVPVLPADRLKGREPRAVTWSNFGGNLPVFQQASYGAGYVNPITDPDGSVRRVPLLARYGNGYYESFALAMVRALLGNPELVPGLAGESKIAADGYSALDWLDLPTKQGTLRIPVDGDIAALVPYRGYEKSYRYFSVSDFLSDRIRPEQLQGKIALVGTTAPGLKDLHTTPVDEVYPGVEVHANLIMGMLDGSIKLKPQYAMAVEFLTLLLLGGLMIFVFPWRSPTRAMLSTIFVLLVIIGINFSLWRYANWVQPLASSLLLIGSLFVLNMSYGYFMESRTRRQFAALFEQYVPPELVKKMSRNPQSYSMEGKKAELTVLFSDIRGFTALSEAMEPDQLAQLINEYLSAMTIVIRRQRGTLDKYIGDAIMAFWGAPLHDPDHARNAVITALEMLHALEEFNRSLVARNIPEMKIGIGINTGVMTVGDMGSAVRKAYTVMGDAVNLGSRLESITKQYGVSIIVGDATRRAAKDILFREVDLVQVKGKEAPVSIYEPLGLAGELAPDVFEELDLWHRALHCYRMQEWHEADATLDSLVSMQPDCRLYQLYKERIVVLRKNAPDAAWIGITRFDTQ